MHFLHRFAPATPSSSVAHRSGSWHAFAKAWKKWAFIFIKLSGNQKIHLFFQKVILFAGRVSGYLRYLEISIQNPSWEIRALQYRHPDFNLYVSLLLGVALPNLQLLEFNQIHSPGMVNDFQVSSGHMKTISILIMHSVKVWTNLGNEVWAVCRLFVARSAWLNFLNFLMLKPCLIDDPHSIYKHDLNFPGGFQHSL